MYLMSRSMIVHLEFNVLVWCERNCISKEISSWSLPMFSGRSSMECNLNHKWKFKDYVLAEFYLNSFLQSIFSHNNFCLKKNAIVMIRYGNFIFEQTISIKIAWQIFSNNILKLNAMKEAKKSCVCGEEWEPRFFYIIRWLNKNKMNRKECPLVTSVGLRRSRWFNEINRQINCTICNKYSLDWQ